MPLSTSPFEIINPNDRYIPTLKNKDLTKVLPPLVTKIRQEVFEWREKNYEGVSDTTRTLLQWWFIKEHENFRYYFAQREAVETIIYLFEVAKIRDKDQLFNNYNSLTDVTLQHFTESWLRLVTKMATGSGKTKVMSLLLLWSYFNRIYENNNELSANFLIIAPNIIVLDRLKTDFENLNIFRNDPCVPDDGVDNQNWKIDFLSTVEVHLPSQARIKNKQGNIFLTNVQQIYVGRDKEVSFEDEDLTEFFFGSKVKNKLENKVDLLKLIKQVKELIIINDEAHHINDEQQVWYKTIQNIHNSLTGNDSRLAIQLDFTATPKHKDSSIFVQTVSDYPLVEAIHQNIVKNIEVPKPMSVAKEEFEPLPSSKFSEKWRRFIDLGYIEWKKSYNICKETGKKAIFFVMTDDTTNCDDVAQYLENNYDDLRGRVLTIHTNKNGEIIESENAPKKTKDELQKLRHEANTIDNMDNKNLAVVSVLMLKEGWDVNNVTTIVGLRAYSKPKILPEQTLGRGLRKMYRKENIRERLTVIGTPNFMEFAKDLEEQGIKVKEIDVGEDVPSFFITSKLVEDDETINKFDIQFPQIVEKVFRNDELIKTIDVSKFEFKKLSYQNLDLTKKIKIEWEFTVSKETSRVEEYERSYDLDVYNILAHFAKEIMEELKLKQGLGFDIICSKTKDLIENYLFGQKIQFDSELTRANLCIIETRRAIVHIMVSEIKKVIINDKSEKKIGKILKFSDDKSPKIKDAETAIYYEPEKSVYDRHFLDNPYEEAMNIYLESLPDVVSCIKNMGFIKIPYQKLDGVWSVYIPDFFIKLSDKDYCILETKGGEYINDPVKRDALKNKVKQINEGQDKVRFTTLYVLQTKFEKLQNKPTTFKTFFEMFKDLDLN